MNWKTSNLAIEIWNRQDATGDQTLLSVVMPDIEKILASGAPASLDFTLHDSEHGFRVAQMSAKLVADVIKRLSTSELTLLLLAAYCHDIGMSPHRSKVANHFNYLLTGDKSLLSKAELTEFQGWMDTYRGGLTAPVDATSITRAGIKTADDAVSYFARSKHNDWSEDFIRSELGSLTISLYAGWVDDLVALCRSHHEGIAELRQNRFDAKNVGSPSTVVNLRYLAAVLRVADVLEFAPERTPDVVLRFRDIAPKSRIYWFKDHSISFIVDNISKKMIFSAQTPSAYIHKAVLDTATYANDELAVCSILEQEGAFSRGIILANVKTVYQWPWPSQLISDIREKAGQFSYIAGNFRPDTQKVLNLLSGTALYREPIIAARELVQNAVDAVREQIAYTRLASIDPSDEKMAAALSSIHAVTISVSFDGEDYWLSCSDDGSGMTRTIIERHLLVSGSGTQGESRRLARAANEAGFSVERTGRFGIGVLSYFMLADHLQIVTRRSQESGDIDGSAWKFVTQGIDGFGELTKESRSSKGTTIALRLRPEMTSDGIEKFFNQLSNYLFSTFRWLPCRLIVRNEVGTVSQKEVGPGWTSAPSNYALGLVRTMLLRGTHQSSSLLTEREIKEKFERAIYDATLIDWAQTKIRWTDPVEVTWKEGKGVIRAALPYFELDGGISYHFFDVRQFPVINEANGKWAQSPKLTNSVSLHGVAVSGSSPDISDLLVDIDLRGNEEIMVDRSKFVGSPLGHALNKAALVREDLWREFLTKSLLSIFHEVNLASCPLTQSSRASFYRDNPAWPIRAFEIQQPSIRSLSFPLLSVCRTSFYDWDSYAFRTDSCNDEAIPLPRDGNRESLRFHNVYGGGRVVHQPYRNDNTGRSGVVAIQWDDSSELKEIDGTVRSATSLFPVEWSNIASIMVEGRSIYNEAHFLVAENLDSPIATCSGINISSISAVLSDAKTTSAGARAFVFRCISLPRRSLIWLQENHRSDVEYIFKLAGVKDAGSIITLDATNFGPESTSIDIVSTILLDKWVSYDIPLVDKSLLLFSSELWERN